MFNLWNTIYPMNLMFFRQGNFTWTLQGTCFQTRLGVAMISEFIEERSSLSQTLIKKSNEAQNSTKKHKSLRIQWRGSIPYGKRLILSCLKVNFAKRVDPNNPLSYMIDPLHKIYEISPPNNHQTQYTIPQHHNNDQNFQYLSEQPTKTIK